MTYKHLLWTAATAAVLVWSIACGSAGPGQGEVLGSGGMIEERSLGTLDGVEDFARFMETIASPLVGVLGTLKDVSVHEAACPMGGTAVIDRDLGEATFTACQLGGITVSGNAVLADGGSTDTQQSSILAGGAFSLSGNATGSVLIQLAQFTWQEPPVQATTTWRATFENGMTGQICVQSSGEPC